MAKSKYETIILPRLDEVKQWVSEGLTDREIIKRLGISSSTWYKHKSEITEFSETVRESREPKIAELENTMFKLANGYFVEVTKGMKCREVYYDDNGRKCEKEEVHSYIETVHVPANFNAGKFLLINWSDKYSNDPTLIKVRKEEFEHKKKMDELDKW